MQFLVAFIQILSFTAIVACILHQVLATGNYYAQVLRFYNIHVPRNLLDHYRQSRSSTKAQKRFEASHILGFLKLGLKHLLDCPALRIEVQGRCPRCS